MIQPLHKDWLECIGSFNANNVEYLIVGAFAVAHHGRPRLTGDLDLWVKPGFENGQKVIRALKELLGPETSDHQQDQQREPKTWAMWRNCRPSVSRSGPAGR
jgi:hypothetical protein